MSEKLRFASRRHRLQILTLTPKSWSVQKATEFFSVSKCTIQCAQRLKEYNRIAPYPDLVVHQKISQEMLEKVKMVSCDDDISMQLPDKKDYVSMGKINVCQKKLILCNLKELYDEYKMK